MKKNIFIFIVIIVCLGIVIGLAKRKKPEEEKKVITEKVFKGVEEEWVKTYDYKKNRDCIYGVAVDKEGNVYVTGQGFDKETKCNIVTIKYSPNGEIIWEREYNGQANGPDKPYGIVVDKECNVYVLGESEGGEETFYDLVVIKYDKDGNECWVRRYDGPAHDDDFPIAITVDDLCNVYVIGEIWAGEEKGYEDIVVIKYDKNGNEQWVRTYNGLAGDWDTPNGIAIDKDYNVYVGGGTWNEETDDDFILIKYAQKYEEITKELTKK